MTDEMRIYRESVPVDDEWHTITMAPLKVLHVGCRQADQVEFWHFHADDMTPEQIEFRVFGTGQLIPECGYAGTAVSPSGELVWHLVFRKVPLGKAAMDALNRHIENRFGPQESK